MTIISKAPTRISMFGGGSDCNPFNAKHGGKVLNFAINLRHIGTLRPRSDKWVWIEAMGESRIWRVDKPVDYGVDPKFDLMRAIVNSYKLKQGLYYVDKFEGIQGAGLGSSASAAVAFIGAMNRWRGVKQSALQIAKKAWRMEAYELGWFSGWQDQTASALGGFHVLSYKWGGISPEPLKKVWINSFLPWCVLVFTGKTRKSSKIQQAFYKDMKDKMNKQKTMTALFKLKELVDKGKKAFSHFDFYKLGELLEENWKWKKRSSPKASNPRIDKIYSFAKKHGAIGGKVLGAGQEGHILFIVEPKRRKEFVEAMENEGLKEIDFSMCWNGLEIRKV